MGRKQKKQVSSTKKCTKCGISKRLDQFHKNKNNNDSLNSWCKDCCSESKKDWYKRKKCSEAIDTKLSVQENIQPISNPIDELNIKTILNWLSKENYKGTLSRSTNYGLEVHELECQKPIGF